MLYISPKLLYFVISVNITSHQNQIHLLSETPSLANKMECGLQLTLSPDGRLTETFICTIKNSHQRPIPFLIYPTRDIYLPFLTVVSRSSWFNVLKFRRSYASSEDSKHCLFENFQGRSRNRSLWTWCNNIDANHNGDNAYIDEVWILFCEFDSFGNSLMFVNTKCHISATLQTAYEHHPLNVYIYKYHWTI